MYKRLKIQSQIVTLHMAIECETTDHSFESNARVKRRRNLVKQVFFLYYSRIIL